MGLVHYYRVQSRADNELVESTGKLAGRPPRTISIDFRRLCGRRERCKQSGLLCRQFCPPLVR